MRNKENYGNAACESRGDALRIRMNLHSRARSWPMLFMLTSPLAVVTEQTRRYPDCVYTIRLRGTYVSRHTFKITLPRDTSDASRESGNRGNRFRHHPTSLHVAVRKCRPTRFLLPLKHGEKSSACGSFTGFSQKSSRRRVAAISWTPISLRSLKVARLL